MPDSAALKLQTFSHRIRLGKLILKCAVCNDFRSCSGEMQRHLYNTHGGPDKHFCPWCTSNVVRWLPNEKRFHVKHLIKCFDKYEKLYCTQDIRTVHKSGELQKRFWNGKVEKCNVPIPCVRCKKSEIYPRRMEKHYREFHSDNVDVNSQCVWCDGQYDGKDAHHLNACFDKILSDIDEKNSMEIEQLEIEPIDVKMFDKDYESLMNLDPMCTARHFFGRKKLPNLNSNAYTHLFLLPKFNKIQSDGLTFRQNVETANAYLTMFRSDPELKWYHVIVRAAAFDSFYKIMENTDRSSFFLTHFWTWCDGGHYESDYFNHHRHMILVTRDPAFMDTDWKKVRFDDDYLDLLKDEKKIKCKTSKPIETDVHLINTIGYLSKQSSLCDMITEKSPRKDHHFCIGTSLPKSFKKCLHGVGGTFDYLLSQLFGKKSVKDYVDIVNREDGKYQLQVKYLSNEINVYNEVLPVERHWRPNRNLTEGKAYMNLLNGKKLYFERDDSLKYLARNEWNKEQSRCGNSFFGIMQDEYFTLCEPQQKNLNLVMPFVEKARNLEIKNNDLRADNLEKTKEIEKLRKENVDLREKFIKQLEDDKTRLLDDKARLQEEVKSLREEIKILRDEKIQNLEEKIQKLEEENKTLREEVKCLREENKKLREYIRKWVKTHLLDDEDKWEAKKMKL